MDIVGYFRNYFEIPTARLFTFILFQLSILLSQVEFADRLVDFLFLKIAILLALLQSEVYIDLICHFNTVGHFTAHKFPTIINLLHAPPTHTHTLYPVFQKVNFISASLLVFRQSQSRKNFIFFRFLLSFIVYTYNTFLVLIDPLFILLHHFLSTKMGICFPSSIYLH